MHSDFVSTHVHQQSHLKDLYMMVCLASNNSFSSWKSPGINVGSRISETSWDLAVMKRSFWNLSKWHLFHRIEYAVALFFIPSLNEASLQLIGDLIDAEDEGDVK